MSRAELTNLVSRDRQPWDWLSNSNGSPTG